MTGRPLVASGDIVAILPAEPTVQAHTLEYGVILAVRPHRKFRYYDTVQVLQITRNGDPVPAGAEQTITKLAFELSVVPVPRSLRRHAPPSNDQPQGAGDRPPTRTKRQRAQVALPHRAREIRPAERSTIE